jgi:hypothetical protein
MNLTETLFKRDSLLFESYFGNILFLKKEDIEFLHSVCELYFDPFNEDLKKNFKTTTLNSSLFEMLHKESKVKLKNQARVFWESESYDPNDNPIGLSLVSTNGYIFENSEKYVLTKMLREDRIVLYLPLLLDWAHYYLPKSINDSVYARHVIYSLQKIFKDQPTRRELIIVNVPNDISTIVKGPK